jgi:hypothetical protein
VRVPAPPWLAPTNVRLLGETTVGGRPAWLVSFVDRPFGTQTWFQASIDRATHRTLDVRMTAPAHFMHDRFLGFNDGARVRPPRGQAAAGS